MPGSSLEAEETSKPPVHLGTEALDLLDSNLYAAVPAVKYYFLRGLHHCGDYAWGGKMDLPDTDWRQSIFLHSKGQTGVSQVMFLQVQYLVAWMTRRPIVHFTEGPLWKFLHSRHMGSSTQMFHFGMEQLFDPWPAREAWKQHETNLDWRCVRSKDLQVCKVSLPVLIAFLAPFRQT